MVYGKPGRDEPQIVPVFTPATEASQTFLGKDFYVNDETDSRCLGVSARNTPRKPGALGSMPGPLECRSTSEEAS